MIKEPFYPTENILADFEYVIKFFTFITGKHPETGVDMSLFNALKKDIESAK